MDIPFPFGRRSFQSEFIDQATHHKNITFIQWGTNIYSYGLFSFPTPKYSEALVQTFNQSIADTIFFAGHI